ncbi:SAM-binding domain protein [Peptostreptococcaceae bacterium AS15]|nr:SAM-binding domain protein [Peptostreptococcaceae bacterium AS15]
MEKYRIVYADSPWKYEKNIGQGVAEEQYKTMKIDDICALPVKEIVSPDSLLFLWFAFPQLTEGFKVIKAWGFEYKTVAFVWVKLNKKKQTPFFGLGHWTRSNAEICLLAKRGMPKRKSNKVHQLIFSPIEGHSKKPDIVRDKIVELVGDMKRIELFARNKTDGWDVWGNEVISDISLSSD